jgi:hypothetical protein
MLLYSFFNDAVISILLMQNHQIYKLGTTLKILFMLKEIVTSLEAVHVTPKSVT